MWRARTVEGDLGMRWNAVNVIEAATLEHLLTSDDDAAGLSAYAATVAADPSYLPEPGSAQDRLDLRIAQLAATIALRRHGRPAGPSANPRPLKDVGLVVGSGGVLRHHDEADRLAVLAAAVNDHGGGWRVPSGARVVVDHRYVLFAAGLLATSEDAGLRLAGARLVAGEIAG